MSTLLKILYIYVKIIIVYYYVYITYLTVSCCFQTASKGRTEPRYHKNNRKLTQAPKTSADNCYLFEGRRQRKVKKRAVPKFKFFKPRSISSKQKGNQCNHCQTGSVVVVVHFRCIYMGGGSVNQWCCGLIDERLKFRFLFVPKFKLFIFILCQYKATQYSIPDGVFTTKGNSISNPT